MSKFQVGDPVLYHDGKLFIHATVEQVFKGYEHEDVKFDLKKPLYEIVWNGGNSSAMVPEDELSKVL